MDEDLESEEEEKKYKCRYCGEEFSKLHELARHVKLEHPKGEREEEEEEEEEEKKEEKKGKFECKFCHKLFPTKLGLLSHLGQVHKEELKEEEELKKMEEMEKEGTLSLEDEMTLEMEKQLASELRTLPGLSPARRQYILSRFKNVSALRENPSELHAIIARNSKADDNDINLTVSSVFRIRDEYMQRMMRGRGGMYLSQQPFYPQYPPSSPPYTSQYTPPYTPQSRYPPYYHPYYSSPYQGQYPPFPLYTEEDVRRRAEREAERIANRKMELYKKEQEIKKLEEYIGEVAQEIRKLKEGESSKESNIRDFFLELRRIEKEAEEKREEAKKEAESFKESILQALIENRIKGEKESPMEKLASSIIQSQIESKKEAIAKEELSNLLANQKREIERLIEEKERERKDKEVVESIKKLQETIKNLPRGSGGYSSDDARLLADGIAQIGKKMDQTHDTVKLAISNLPSLVQSFKTLRETPTSRAQFSEEELRRMERAIDETTSQQLPTEPGRTKKEGIEGVLERELKDYISEK